MQEKKKILIIALVVLTAVFLALGTGALLLAGYRRREEKELKRQEALRQLESIPTAAPSPTATPVPTPLPSPTFTPSPIPTRAPAFSPEEFTGSWYSADGRVSMKIYELDARSILFSFRQTDPDSGLVSEADVSAEVAGNAAQFSFTDSLGSAASGNVIFDHGRLYVRIRSEEAGRMPGVDGILQREQPSAQTEAAPEPTLAPQQPSTPGDFYFPDSDRRYLTDEELSRYSSSDLELAKNEIYARHGRKFVTERIAEYFNGKSWYHGTIEAETFDSMPPESIFNEYELANISRLVSWEEKKREEGN